MMILNIVTQIKKTTKTLVNNPKGSILDESLNYNEDNFDPLQPSKVYNNNNQNKVVEEKKNADYFLNKPNNSTSLPPLNKNDTKSKKF